MTHTEKVIEAVDNALARYIIREMNILLCELSEDANLTREFRFEQQHRLRLAVFRHSTEKKELAEQRRKWLTQGGIIC